MGFVDNISRHPSGEPVPVSLDDEKFVIASVNQISMLLGFDHLMPRNSWSQIRNKFSQHFLAHDITSCNTIGQSTDHMTSQEIEREKRIANAAETFQAIANYSNISVCHNSHSRTEQCDSSCKINDFFTNFNILKEMAEQIEFNQQKELITNENMDSLTPSTSNPSDNPVKRSPSKKKTVNIFPFSWPEIFDSKFMSLLSKQDLVLKKIIKAIEEYRKQDILQLGNYYKSYLNNLHVSGGCLYLDNRLVIPACLRSTMLNRLHEAHPGQFAMKSLATQYIWWPKIYREIQVYGENCIECVKAGKNLKPLINHNTLGKLPTVKEPNQEMELDFAGPLPLVWGTKKYILVCVDRFSKFPSAQITSSTSAKSIINFLSKYIALHGIPRTIRTDQGSGFISKEVREFCHEHNIKLIFSPVGDHRATGLVERLIRTIKERLLVMAQERPKPSLESALLKIIKFLRTVTQQSLNCSPFEAHFGRSPNTIWHNLVKSPSSNNLDWNKTLLCIDKRKKLMS